MADLKVLRENWEQVEAFETELLKKAAIQDKVRDFLELFSEFSEWNEGSEADYQNERETALIAIQQRLQRLESYLAHETTN